MSQRTSISRALAAVAVLLLAFVTFRALAGGPIRFAEGLELRDAEVTREVTPGGTATLKLHLQPSHPLAAREMIFVHCESVSGGVDAVRMNRDGAPSVPSTEWGSQAIEHVVQIPFDRGVKLGRYEIFAGFFDPRGGERLAVVDPPTPDNRVLVGWLDVVAQDPDDELRTISPGAMRFEATWAPWLPWLGGAAVAAAVAGWCFARKRVEDEGAATADTRSLLDRYLPFVAPIVPFCLGINAVLEFIKDDAYISFRYAHNLVHGDGLVFNRGEHVEGFTNFLWVFVVAPFEALGWDLFQVCEVLGTLLGMLCLALVAEMTGWLQDTRRGLSYLWGALWLATSSSFVLWAQAGLEQPLACLLPIAGATLLWREREGERRPRRYLAAGLVLGAACMTRPELHMMAVLVGLPLVVDAVRERSIPRASWLYVAGILAVTVPCHTFRYLYYGSLVPNTFYVKTGTGAVVWHVGLKSLRDMFLFNHSGLLAIVAPMAFANRRHVALKGTMALIAAAFMTFYVSVGVDEMQWHRLFLPALPFLCVLAALGAFNTLELLARLAPKDRLDRARVGATGLGWAAFLVASASSFQFTYKEVNGFNGHGDLAGTFHPDLGKFLVRHERPHALVAFQDMGSTPYHAPDIDFLDFFGLVDHTVAHARHDFGLHTFIGSTGGDAQARYDAQMRDYFFGRKPEWTIFTIYTPRGDENKLAKEFETDPTGAAFGDAFRHNGVQFDLWNDPRFRAQYVPVRTWPRSRSYYLTLFRRRDLWEQKPREVVLDAPPNSIAGVKAKLEGGLELLGSETTPSAPERHEMFVTTWWKLPGPMPDDTYFFVHLVKGNQQVPSDHVPGDWMYPAGRWQAGEILEDRNLIQFPPFVVHPGTYSVFLGAYRRSTGERLKVLEGPNDGQNRIPLGTIEVTPLRPFIQQLIPPTHVETMRRYPDRIVDSHRN